MKTIIQLREGILREDRNKRIITYGGYGME